MVTESYFVYEFLNDEIALAGLMYLIGIFGIIVGKMLYHTKAWREIHQKIDYLSQKTLSNTKFSGKLHTTLSKETNIAFIVMYSSLFTLKSLKENLYENAIDTLSNIYFVQICALIITIPYHQSGHKISETLTESLPTVEIAIITVFIYVMWRVGHHWKMIAFCMSPVILVRLEKEMSQVL